MIEFMIPFYTIAAILWALLATTCLVFRKEDAATSFYIAAILHFVIAESFLLASQ